MFYVEYNTNKTRFYAYLWNYLLASCASNCSLVITGECNRLNIESITLQLGLESKVNFSTRGFVKLDDILTDVADCEPAEKVSSLSRNDHCCILLKKQLNQLLVNTSIYIKERLPNTAKLCFFLN